MTLLSAGDINWIEEFRQESDENKRFILLNKINSLLDIDEILTLLRQEINDNFDNILSNLFVGWPWMLKLVILNDPDLRISYHLFWLEMSNWHAVENKHMHSFQAVSNILTWTVFENKFLFNKATKLEEEAYIKFIDWSESQPKKIVDDVFLDLDNILQSKKWLYSFTKKVANSLWISVELLAQMHTVFDSTKVTNEAWQVIGEDFFEKGIFMTPFLWTRKIRQWNTYSLKSDIAHQIWTQWETSTLFVADTTYRDRWYKKINDVMMRGIAKKLPSQQSSFETRSAVEYMDNPENIKAQLLSSLDKIKKYIWIN